MPKQQYIYAPNHPSTIDPFYLLGVIKQKTQILIIQSVFTIPLLRFFVKQAGHIKVDMKNGGQAYKKAVMHLNKGRSLMVFPEGLVSKPGFKISEIKTGAVRMAMETKTPIIPVGIYINKNRIKRKRKDFGFGIEVIRWYMKGNYVVNFGEPIIFKGDFRDRNLVRYNCSLLYSEINKLVDKSKLEYAILRKDPKFNIKDIKRWLIYGKYAKTFKQIAVFFSINNLFK
jgi:1-acyl-sn-glycerol-3-phosphate acyltransferase